jgi:hypothetical protein
MQGQQPGHLLDGVVVMVHAQVQEAIVVTTVARARLGHQERGRFLAPAVPALALGGPQRLQKPVGQRPASGSFEGLGHRRNHRGGRQDVALAREPPAGDGGGVLEAPRAGEGG